MSEPTDTARLLALGAQITLKDGSKVRLVMDAERMATIEDEFDGLEKFAEVLRRKPIRSIATALRVFCGLPDEKAALRAMDTRRITEYVTAIGDALAEALPAQDEGAAGNGVAALSASPGAAGTTSPSSSAILPPPRSGA